MFGKMILLIIFSSFFACQQDRSKAPADVKPGDPQPGNATTNPNGSVSDVDPNVVQDDVRPQDPLPIEINTILDIAGLRRAPFEGRLVSAIVGQTLGFEFELLNINNPELVDWVVTTGQGHGAIPMQISPDPQRPGFTLQNLPAGRYMVALIVRDKPFCEQVEGSPCPALSPQMNFSGPLPEYLHVQTFDVNVTSSLVNGLQNGTQPFLNPNMPPQFGL